MDRQQQQVDGRTSPAGTMASTPKRASVRRVLEWTARFFDARHAVLLVERSDDQPLAAAYGLADEQARALARPLLVELRRHRARSRVWTHDDPAIPNSLPPIVVAARPDPETPGDGLLAVFGAEPAERFDAEAAGGLCQLLACNAGAMVETVIELERIHSELDARALRIEHLDRVTRHLERHSRRTERSLASRTRFFAALSHELRTPLNAIIGYNQLLEQGIFGAVPDGQVEILRKVRSSAHQLLTLVSDILDLSKIDAGKITLHHRPTDVPAIVAEATDAIAPQAREKGLAIRAHTDSRLPTISSDPDRVRQIVLNLLANAVKFTDEGGIDIGVEHLDADAAAPDVRQQAWPPGPDGWIRIAVRDTGIGIPEHQIESIFDEFEQAGPVGTRHHGTGLGLAIAHRLARNLGGALTVRSTVGVESTFSLFLPCPAPPVEHSPNGA